MAIEDDAGYLSLECGKRKEGRLDLLRSELFLHILEGIPAPFREIRANFLHKDVNDAGNLQECARSGLYPYIQVIQVSGERVCCDIYPKIFGFNQFSPLDDVSLLSKPDRMPAGIECKVRFDRYSKKYSDDILKKLFLDRFDQGYIVANAALSFRRDLRESVPGTYAAFSSQLNTENPAGEKPADEASLAFNMLSVEQNRIALRLDGTMPSRDASRLRAWFKDFPLYFKGQGRLIGQDDASGRTYSQTFNFKPSRYTK
jgi:hypothetical protein